MQKTFFTLVLVLCLSAYGWSAHLMSPRACLPCVLAANSLRGTDDNSLDTIFTIAAQSEDDSRAGLFIDMDKLRATTFGALFKLRDDATRPRHNKRLVNCEFATLPVRHARSAEARDDPRLKQIGKRRAVSDLTLCHFKICNMGRKRNSRYVNALVNDN